MNRQIRKKAQRALLSEKLKYTVAAEGESCLDELEKVLESKGLLNNTETV